MNNLIERDRTWDRDYNKLQERLGRQRADLTDQARWIEVLQGEVTELNEARMLMETQVMGINSSRSDFTLNAAYLYPHLCKSGS